ARRRADRLFTDLWANDDDAQYRAAQQVLSGRYEWFEQDVLDPAGDGPMMPTHPEPTAKQYEGLPAVAPSEVQATATQ
ncbi:MAG: acyl-CoA dehydrogenase, partial [Geodermatophilales bacterium]|nr:acyl-CoA dehydrogenase [Geodermatophilales bacterium]